jgi:hypothetical protein
VIVYYDPAAPRAFCLEPNSGVTLLAALRVLASLAVALIAVLWLLLT